MNREEGRPPHLIREVVTVPDEVGTQGAGAVLRGCRLLVHAQEEGHSLPESRRQSSGSGETKVPEFPRQGIRKES